MPWRPSLGHAHVQHLGCLATFIAPGQVPDALVLVWTDQDAPGCGGWITVLLAGISCHLNAGGAHLHHVAVNVYSCVVAAV